MASTLTPTTVLVPPGITVYAAAPVSPLSASPSGSLLAFTSAQFALYLSRTFGNSGSIERTITLSPLLQAFSQSSQSTTAPLPQIYPVYQETDSGILPVPESSRGRISLGPRETVILFIPVRTVLPRLVIVTDLYSTLNRAIASQTSAPALTSEAGITIAGTPQQTSIRPPSTQSPVPDVKGPSIPTIVGATVGSVLGVVLIVIGIWVFHQRRGREPKSKSNVFSNEMIQT